MRILFMGTPDFALFSLRALVDAGEDVIGAVTQPDKPKGRGYALLPPPVKVYAEEKNIPVYQPATLKNEAFLDELRALDPELIVVTAYGKILPPYVLDYPKYGCINVHGSLLPRYRGAAPMQRAIMEGCDKTGVTIMYMAEGLDTGDMLRRAELDILDDDNLETVHDKLGVLGAETLLLTVADLKNGTAVRTVQDDAQSTYAAKITPEDCAIPFSDTAKAVHDRIRGLSPVPLCFTHTPDGKLLKLIRTHVVSTEPTGKVPGTVLSLDGGVITVACGSGSIAVERLLPEGKSRMNAADYILGRKLCVGDVLS